MNSRVVLDNEWSGTGRAGGTEDHSPKALPNKITKTAALLKDSSLCPAMAMQDVAMESVWIKNSIGIRIVWELLKGNFRFGGNAPAIHFVDW